jgi:tetratricopeptide (TPR) repeat protein
MNNKVKALALAAIACSLLNATPCFAQRQLAISLYESGIEAYKKGNYADALRMLRKSKEATTNLKFVPIQYAALEQATGETLRALGQFQEAEKCFKNALNLLDDVPPKQNFLTPVVFNSMALMYRDQGRFPEAEGLWKQADTLYKGKSPYAINHLAYLYFLWGKNDEELEYMNRCIKDSKHTRDVLSIPYTEFNQAVYAQQKGDYKTASLHYTNAIEACTHEFGEKHFYYTVILTDMAEMYRQMSRYADAEKAARTCLTVRQDSLPADHPNISESKVKLARILAEEGKYSEARELASNALKTSEAAFGKDDNNLFVARAKNCLGNIYRQDGRYTDATNLLQEALTSEQKIFGQENIDIAVTMRDLALVQEEQANFSEAETLLKNSQRIINTQAGPDHPERAAAANALGDLYLRDGKYAEAEPLFKQALELSKRALGENNVVTARSARDLGELAVKQNKYAEAQAYFQQALSIDENLYGDKAPQIAGDLMSLATAYGSQGQSAQAEPLLKRAAEIKNVLPGGGAVAIEAPIALPSGADRPVTGKWALVVGVSNFKDASINLKYAAKDATDFKNFLINTEHFKADHVKLLTDETATRENIIGLMGDKWLASHVKPDDLVVVYVSSHGSRSQDEAGGVNFLVAHDTNKNSLLATGIPMQWLTKMVKEQVHSDRVVLILDVCHSGAAGQGAKSLTRAAALDPRTFNIGSGQMIICSSLAEQVSWESSNYENSVFTRRLMEALQSKKDKTTLIEAYNQLKVLVESEVLRDRAELQTPVLWNKGWTGKDPVLAGETIGSAN